MNRLQQPSHLVRYIWRHPEVREHRVRALSRLVAWQCWERLVRRPWTTRLRGDIRLRCYPHNTAASGVLYVRYPEWREMRFLVDFLRPGDLFVDVGANVGVYSLLACSVPGVEVWAFEPSNEAFAHALENVRINHLGDRLHVVRAAVSKRAGRGFLTIGLDTVNRLDHTRSHPNEAVEVVELDSYLADTREDLTKLSAMKVDVEGSEPDVLAGAFRLLDDASPVLVIERNKPEELREMLSPRGYVPFDYDPLTGTFDVADWIEGTSPNLLLSKDFDHMAARFGAPPHHEVT